MRSGYRATSTGLASMRGGRRQSARRVPAFATVGFTGALLLAVLGGRAIATLAGPAKLVPVARAPAGSDRHRARTAAD